MKRTIYLHESDQTGRRFVSSHPRYFDARCIDQIEIEFPVEEGEIVAPRTSVPMVPA